MSLLRSTEIEAETDNRTGTDPKTGHTIPSLRAQRFHDALRAVIKLVEADKERRAATNLDPVFATDLKPRVLRYVRSLQLSLPRLYTLMSIANSAGSFAGFPDLQTMPDDQRYKRYDCLMGDYRSACSYLGRAAYTILIHAKPGCDSEAIELIELAASWPGASLAQDRAFDRLRKRMGAWLQNILVGLTFDYGLPSSHKRHAATRKIARRPKKRPGKKASRVHPAHRHAAGRSTATAAAAP